MLKIFRPRIAVMYTTILMRCPLSLRVGASRHEHRSLFRNPSATCILFAMIFPVKGSFHSTFMFTIASPAVRVALKVRQVP
jgi:hypothetical protein